MSIEAFRNEVMDVLAVRKRCDRAVLEAQLRQAGPECPFDSIYLLRVAIRVARNHGLTLKPSREIERSFKSVEGVATLLSALEANQEAA